MTAVSCVARGLAARADARRRPAASDARPLLADGRIARRAVLLALTACAPGWLPRVALATNSDSSSSVFAALQAEAASAFSSQDFATADAALTQLIKLDGANVNWLEGRAQVRCDAKRFNEALADFDAALAFVEQGSGAGARLLSGRALAHEGLYQWEAALQDYNAAMRSAQAAGLKPDPYVLNSRGNVLASLGRWADAREDYLASAAIFQSSAGYRRGASTTSRLDGAIYSAANAALMRAQLGDDVGAQADLSAVARRAPNSADARAAQAALLWALGRPGDAESAWESACLRAEGCARYKDLDYVARIRRWPPRMVAHLTAFLQLQNPPPPST